MPTAGYFATVSMTAMPHQLKNGGALTWGAVPPRMLIMNCPVCKEAMLTVEYEAVEIDFCVSCRGVWLDAGELELLFGDQRVTDSFLKGGDASHASGEAPRPCPICDGKMEKHVTGGPSPVVYDQCRQNHGLWFDRGELASVLKHGGDLPGGGPIAEWLRHLFSEQPESNS